MKEQLWLKIILIILIPVFCYLPAFALVFLSSNLFKPSNLSGIGSAPTQTQNPAPNSTVPVPSPSGIYSTINPAATQPSLTSPEASVYNELIKVLVESEVRKQSEQAAKDEVEKLKAEYKGDVFVQIAFPIIFAIASIFAAFAVKDIVTKLLEEQEKDRIKAELERTLRGEIVPNAIAKENEDINDKLTNIKAYVSWLEHQILNIFMTQTIDYMKESSIDLQNETKLLSAIEKLVIRSKITLKEAEPQFLKKDFKNINEFEQQFFEIKRNSVKLSDDLMQTEREEKDIYPGQSLYQAQMGLVRIVLNKLLTEDNECSLETETKDLLDKIDKILAEDARAEYKKHESNIHEIEEISQVKPPRL